MSYIKISTKCKCGHPKARHIISGRRPTKDKPLFASCGRGSYPESEKYKGKCLRCKCDCFELDNALCVVDEVKE